TNVTISRRRSSLATFPWLSGSVLNLTRTIAKPSASDSMPTMSSGASTSDPQAGSRSIVAPTSRIVPSTRSMFSLYAIRKSTMAYANCLPKFASEVIVPLANTWTAPPTSRSATLPLQVGPRVPVADLVLQMLNRQVGRPHDDERDDDDDADVDAVDEKHTHDLAGIPAAGADVEARQRQRHADDRGKAVGES